MPPVTKEQLTERAQLVRIHEANCAIDYPTSNELNFRFAIMKKLAEGLGLKELRSMTMDGPASGTPQRPTRPNKG